MVVPVIPVLGALRQEAHESEVSLGYCGTISFCENIAHSQGLNLCQTLLPR